MLEKIKSFFSSIPLKDLFTPAFIVLVGIASFGLGVLSERESKGDPVRLYAGETVLFEEGKGGAQTGSGGEKLTASANNSNTDERVVASKNSDKYHLPWCSGAERIKEENKVWFNSREEAEAAGYLPAGNCPGL